MQAHDEPAVDRLWPVLAPKGKGKRETLRFTVRLMMAPGHGGPDAGDDHVFAGDLYQGSKDVGDYRGFCIVTVAGPQHLQPT